MPHKDPVVRKKYLREWAREKRRNSPDFRKRENERSRNHQRKRRKENPKAVAREKRNRQLRENYGITIDDYEQMATTQNGHCAICQSKPDQPLAVDHCHETGKIRGLLCASCNNGLGRFRDDTSRLLAAASYLTKEKT